MFTALATSIKPLHDVLKCISFKPQALVRISEDGLRVSVEDSKSLQAHAFLENNLFSTYSYKSSEVISFGISLAALMEVLSIYNPAYGSSFAATNNPLRLGNTLRIIYKSVGSSLDLVLEDQNVVTKCQLTTYEPDDMVDIELISDPVPSKIIMRGEWLVDAITELDASQTDVLNIRQSPRRPFLRLSARGLLGSVQMDYPNDRSVLETFICAEEHRNSYKFSMIKQSARAMKEASKWAKEGILSWTFECSQ
ncbi:hypothetical protein MRB53_039196 [Persea americana]|nr:hypothetical protein MRB53_039196 [Persea americana]